MKFTFIHTVLCFTIVEVFAWYTVQPWHFLLVRFIAKWAVSTTHAAHPWWAHTPTLSMVCVSFMSEENVPIWVTPFFLVFLFPWCLIYRSKLCHKILKFRPPYSWHSTFANITLPTMEITRYKNAGPFVLIQIPIPWSPSTLHPTQAVIKI